MENENGGESKKQRQKHPETKKTIGEDKDILSLRTR